MKKAYLRIAASGLFLAVMVVTLVLVLTVDVAVANHLSQYSIGKTGPTSSSTGSSQVYAENYWTNKVRGWFGLPPMLKNNVPVFTGKIIDKASNVEIWLNFERLRYSQPDSWKSAPNSMPLNDGGSRPDGSCDSKC